jgi:hypothetical protein
MAKKIIKSFLVISLLVVFLAILSGCSGSLDGTWHGGSTYYEFSGSRVTQTRPGGRVWTIIDGNRYYFQHHERRGTFTISGNQIEFIWTASSSHLPDGRIIEHDVSQGIEARSFSRTDNTLTMGGRRYTRQ